MNARRLLSLPLVVVCIAPLAAQSRVPPDLRRAMDQRAGTAAKGDVATWDRLTADDFILILPDGTTRTKAERLAQIKAQQPSTPTPPTNETVRIHGTTAVQRSQVGGNWVVALWSKDRAGWRVNLVQVAPVSGDSASVRQAIESTNARFAEAFKRGDAQGAAASYANDAVLMLANAPAAEGLDAIKQAFVQFFSTASLTDFKFTTHDVVISGNTAIERGTYEMRLRPKSATGAGTDMVDTGKYLTVWERQADGSWKIIRDINNSDRPASM